MEYYDELVKIWGGCPAAEPLPFGISSSEVNNTDRRVYSDDVTDDNVDFSFGEDVDNQIDVVTSINHEKGGKKRKLSDNYVPKLIDDKRKKMERHLSAAQRDQLLFNEAKEDALFEKTVQYT